MQINISNAIRYFFSNSSLEMVYYEAVANSIDAGATEINISINIKSFLDPGSLEIIISDNGEGFIDKNFDKFSKLLEVDEDTHKGVGRLVFLNYFDKILVESWYNHSIRKFEFTGTFDGECEYHKNSNGTNKTSLTFNNYTKDKIKTYDYLRPQAIVQSLLQNFFPLFYNMKVEGKHLSIKIKLTTEEPNPEHRFYNDTAELVVQNLPEMDKISFEARDFDLFEKFNLYYIIKNTDRPVDPITAISVDGRTHHLDILSNGGIPYGYEVIFILFSNLFKGMSDASRQELKIKGPVLNAIKKVFGEKVAQILNDKIPIISEQNSITNESLNATYPHLTGYFDEGSVGLIDRGTSLENAQARFFKAQKEVLESQSLDDDQFIKSLEISSRILTEYILYRKIIIERLKNIDTNDGEPDIHNLIVPMKRTFRSHDLISDIYNNNAWLLDDKYMSYTTILSDESMEKLLEEILIENESLKKDETRPDISIVFSKNPESEETKFDVVIIELKKLGLKLAKKEEVISQLRQRARKLLNYYPNQIQRIWFYGLVDFDPEFIRSLKEDDFLEVFSADRYYYKEIKIIPDYNESAFVPTGVNLLSFEAFIEDAEMRNSTFFEILKEGLKKNKKPIKK